MRTTSTLVSGAAATVAAALTSGMVALPEQTPPAQGQPAQGAPASGQPAQGKPAQGTDKPAVPSQPAAKPALPVVHPESGLTLVPMKVATQDVVVELANTQASRTRGLGGRKDVPVGTGMLFAFPYVSVLNFWMKDCLVAIDVAFMDADGRVLAVHTMPAEPLQGQNESMAAYEARLKRYSSNTNAVYALELREGEFKRLGIQPGSVITLPSLKR